MLLVKWSRWSLDVVASGCCWSNGSGGLWVLLVNRSRWPAVATRVSVTVYPGRPDCCH